MNNYHGLVDLQVNGYAGVDFNAPSLTAGDVRATSRRLFAEGIAAYLPTLVTNDLAAMERLADIILSAAEPHQQDEAQILGLHLEGPFISPHDGARGAHSKQWVRPPDADWLHKIHERTNGRVRIMTLSPEWENAASYIAAARSLNIRVAIGHTLATHAQIADAINAGATLSTHLGNAIPPMLPRHPNPIWSQLADDRLHASLVADGFHLPQEFFQTVLKVKKEKAFIVSDCTQFAGMPPGRYTSPIGGEVVLTPEGRLHLASDERLLAGSAFSLRRMVDFLVASRWLRHEEALEMASARPLEFLREAS